MLDMIMKVSPINTKQKKHSATKVVPFLVFLKISRKFHAKPSYCQLTIGVQDLSSVNVVIATPVHSCIVKKNTVMIQVDVAK